MMYCLQLQEESVIRHTAGTDAVKTVEVFKTNIISPAVAKRMQTSLSIAFPFCRINFDLEDCDKILRVEGIDIEPELIISLLKSSGYQCEVLN